MKRVIVLNNEFLGKGSDELGAKLMGAFLKKIWASETKPDAMILYNSAVKLLAEGSMVLEAMDALYSAGVDLLACGTCVSYYDLEQKIVAGRVSNMEEIVSIMLKAESVITA